MKETNPKQKVAPIFSNSIIQEELDKFIREATLQLEEKIKELEEAKAGLETKVKERTKELEESKRALMNILEDVEKEREIAEGEKNRTLSIITNLTDGLLLFDRSKKLNLINPQAEKFLNISGNEVINKTISELKSFPTLNSLIKILVGSPSSPQTNEGGDESNAHEENLKIVFREELSLSEELTLEVSSIQILKGREQGEVLVILHDVTREKLVERMKTEFVSVAAHQLRTPLSAIKWTLKMLLEEDLGEITQEQREFIEKVYQSNERMVNLINDLLNVARIEEGRYLYKTTLVDIEQIIQQVLNSFEEEIKRKQIKFGFLMPEKKAPPIRADAEKLTLAIQNLVDNAIKYTPFDGKVIISLESDKKRIKCSVQDTGVGIPKNQQDKVFTKFFRTSNAVKMETEGTGLGLFITKNIIEAHQGKIWFESEEGKGTTFYFTLPVKKEGFAELLKKF